MNRFRSLGKGGRTDVTETRGLRGIQGAWLRIRNVRRNSL